MYKNMDGVKCPQFQKEESMGTRYAWILSKRLNRENVFSRCTKVERYRWKIENNFLIEKHEDCYFEHCFSYTVIIITYLVIRV